MRPVRDRYTDDGLTVVERAGEASPWPLVFAAALVVILALGGGL